MSMQVRLGGVDGVVLTVVCDDLVVLDAVRARLAALPRDDGAHVDVVVTIVTGQPVTPPSAPWQVVYTGARGQVFYERRRDLLVVCIADCSAEVDAEAGTVRITTPDADPVRAWAVSHALFSLPVQECLRRRGWSGLHAAAAVSPEGPSLLLTGPSGSGKSTTTLLLARAGWRVLADDTVFLTPRGGVVGWPDELDLVQGTAELVPDLGGHLDRPLRAGWPKHAFALEQLCGPAWLEGIDPACLVFLSVHGGRPTVVRPMSQHDALLELVPHMLLTRDDVVRDHVARLTTFVAGRPAARMRVGLPSTVEPALRRLLATLK